MVSGSLTFSVKASRKKRESGGGTIHKTILSTDFIGSAKPRRGKVRDIYDLGESILMIATDRISAFDVILPNGIPAKGEVLNRISEFWFRKTEHIIQNHMISTDPGDFPEPFGDHAEALAGRSMLVEKTNSLPVECVVRGYISGSGWEEYKKTGSVCAIPLGESLAEPQKLPEPIFTPSTKAEQGTHDENITFGRVREMIRKFYFTRTVELDLRIHFLQVSPFF